MISSVNTGISSVFGRGSESGIKPKVSGVEAESYRNDKPSDQIDEQKTTQTDDLYKFNDFSAKEAAELLRLKRVATEVRAHEMAHVAAGAQYVTKGASYQYERGPDGVSYEVAGEVSIDTSPVPGDPKATISKMNVIKRAALAPAHPSAQDLKVAARAAQVQSNARMELLLMQSGELNRIGEAAKETERPSQISAGYEYDGRTEPDEKNDAVINLTV